MGILLFLKYFSFYRYEVKNTLWNPGPFVLETLIGLFVINVMGEFGKAFALKHWGGNVPEVCVGLAYRLIPTFHFDISDLWTKKKAVQLKVLSAGLAGQLLLWAVGMLGWRISTSGTEYAYILDHIHGSGTIFLFDQPDSSSSQGRLLSARSLAGNSGPLLSFPWLGGSLVFPPAPAGAGNLQAKAVV